MSTPAAFKLGALEIAGIGFAFGILGGSAASLFGAPFDSIVPAAAGAGAVAFPAIWFSVGAQIFRLICRPRGARAVASASVLVA